ncbi:hypothetical protein [Methanoregula boonei]|nr:hypothetical protein [Methanoregula boonei]
MRAVDAGGTGEGVQRRINEEFMTTPIDMQNLSRIQETIQVAVNYYSNDDREKLGKFPSSHRIEEIVSRKIIQIPREEFLTYYLLFNKGSGVPEYRNYRAVCQYTADALSDMRHKILFNGKSLSAAPHLTDPHSSLPEHLGEAAGLSVISRIHGLIDADWCPIKKMKGADAQKTFDFQIASTGTDIIQVETKGSIVEINFEKSDPIYAHKSNIKEKKQTLDELSKNNKDLNRANIRYGTISAVDQRKDGIIHCWLTDPEPEIILTDPKLLRLFIRLRFLLGWISFFSPRSHFSIALSTRINCLEKIKNPFELDKIPLRKVNGEEFSYHPYLYEEREFDFFKNKSHVTDGPAGGIVLKISENELMFFGMQEDLISIANYQNFEEILNFDFPSDIIDKKVECVLPIKTFKELDLKLSDLDYVGKNREFVKFFLKGSLIYNSSGLVFGPLSVM